MKISRLIALSAILIGAIFSMCAENDMESPVNPECGSGDISFSAQVAPIIQSNCAITGCHNGTQSPSLTTYSSIRDNASRIRTQVITRRMPQNGTLTETQINTLVCWIDSGAPNN